MTQRTNFTINENGVCIDADTFLQEPHKNSKGSFSISIGFDGVGWNFGYRWHFNNEGVAIPCSFDSMEQLFADPDTCKRVAARHVLEDLESKGLKPGNKDFKLLYDYVRMHPVIDENKIEMVTNPTAVVLVSEIDEECFGQKMAKSGQLTLFA